MRTRLAAAALLCGALALPHVARAAGTPTLDGKKVRTLTTSFAPKAQDHDSDFVTGSLGGDDRVNCAADRCGTFPFTFKPAKGVKGDLVFTISWTTPGQDFDLYVVEYAKDGSRSQVATCGAFAGTSEKVVVSSSDLRAGKKYGLLVDYYRTPGTEKVTGTVAFPSSATLKSFPTDTAGVATGCGVS